jgi:uncharacterized protein (DUF2267 family)
MTMDNVDQVGAVLGAPYEGAAEDFFRAITESGALPFGVDAGEATAAVMCVLLSRLDLEQARVVLDALPPAVSDAVGRCPIHGGELGERFGKAAMLARIAQYFELAPEAVEPMTAAVLHALRAQLPPRPATTVEHQLPGDLRPLWRH